jgi:surfactin synthase thioesterase subunit
MAALPSKGKDPTKWPATVKKGSSSWQPLVMLGQALGRAIAHEARHEYLGSGHAESGLGEDAPYLTGEKTTAQFSKDDQKAILERIRKLEATQGTATVVPTFPQSMRQKPEDFPF